MARLADLNLVPSMKALKELPDGKTLINTVNAWSWVLARKDSRFARALKECDVLIPDGMSIVNACRFLNLAGAPAERIAGYDLFKMEMDRLNEKGGKCFFLGSSEDVLSKIRARAAEEYPGIEVITYSPPYKDEFSPEDDDAMISAVNAADPDLLWIGMTAPKQEKWAFGHWDDLKIKCHCGAVGAVFDFYAGTVERAPEKWQKAGFEWLYRLIKEPRRMWKRYVWGNLVFIYTVLREKHG